MEFIDKYKVSEVKQEILNGVTNRWNTCRIKDKFQDLDICFNKIYNIKLKFKKVKK